MTSLVQHVGESFVLNAPNCTAKLGVLFRKETAGPEAELVDCFLNNLHLRLPKGCRATIFREPKLECGIPDIVIVVWHVATAERWGEARTRLAKDDFRMLQFMLWHHRITEEQLSENFANARGALQRLQEAKLVRRTTGKWGLASLSRTFALRSIIAIEAKVSAWSQVLDQAVRNKWFACESYVLVPDPTRFQASAGVNQDVGVLAPSDQTIKIKRRRQTLYPKSYACWLFNDWAWRASGQLYFSR